MTRRFSIVFALAALILTALILTPTMTLASGGHSHDPEPLRILLTNDDGFDSPGIQAMRGALIAAGHDVTIVAPLEQQSGKGGSLSTDVGGFVDVIEEEPGVWSVDSTPSDSVRAALGAVLADDPPDLIVSGANFGQNLAEPGTAASGTIGAALAGLFADIPAIAVSVEILFEEARDEPIPFPSTFAAFGPTADFTVRLIERLQRSDRKGLLPRRTILNVNVPVPYGDVRGVKHTRLGEVGNFDFVWQDVLGVIPSGGGPILINVSSTEDTVRGSDTNAFVDGFIAITLLDGDMTAFRPLRNQIQRRLRGLQP